MILLQLLTLLLWFTAMLKTFYISETMKGQYSRREGGG